MIFIPINTPSSKNSKQFIYRGGRGFLVNSKLTTKYMRDTDLIYKSKKLEFEKMLKGLDKPYLIGFHFVRKTKQRWDFSNLCQAPQDMLVKHGLLEDDNASVMLPVPFKIDGKWYSVDKKNPGVYIKVFSRMELTDMYEYIFKLK